MIDLKVFKTENNKMKTLPKNYVVECTTVEETIRVMNYLQNNKKIWSHWNYVSFMSDKPLDDYNPNIHLSSADFEYWGRRNNVSFTKIKFKEWNEIVNSAAQVGADFHSKINTEFPKYWRIRIDEKSLDSINKIRSLQPKNNKSIKVGDFKYYGFNEKDNYPQCRK